MDECHECRALIETPVPIPEVFRIRVTPERTAAIVSKIHEIAAGDGVSHRAAASILWAQSFYQEDMAHATT